MNPLLARQLRRLGLSADRPPAKGEWESLLRRVGQTYDAADRNRYLLERSLRISSEEMKQVYEELRARSANQLAAERDRLRVVIDAMNEGLCLMDRGGAVLETNASALRLLDREYSEVVGARALEGFVFTPARAADRCDSAESILRSVGAGSQFSDENAMIVTRSGLVIPVAVLVVPVDQEGEVTGSVLVFRDVSERIKAQTRLAASEARYRQLFDQSPVASAELDLSQVAALGRELTDWADTIELRLVDRPDAMQLVTQYFEASMANSAAVELFEARDANHLLQNLAAALTPDSVDALIDVARAIAEKKPRMGTEIAGRTLTGTRLHLLLEYAAPETHLGVDFRRVVMTFTDITQRKQDEERMEELMRLKDEFLATVSHELRTPLSAVVASAALLQEGSDIEAGPEAEELIGFISSESRELAHIIEDLLVGARADTGNLTVSPENVDLSGEVDTVISSAAKALDGRKVDVRLDEERVWADPVRLRQVLRNLLTNAGRYGGRSVEVVSRRDLDRVSICVSDDGPGIPPEDWERVFEPYAAVSGTRGLTGSVGLGLTVSRQLARLMGGDLVYAHGEVSTFTLTLPHAAPTEDASRRAS
jgi:PAS domain S-box-containing protein